MNSNLGSVIWNLSQLTLFSEIQAALVSLSLSRLVFITAQKVVCGFSSYRVIDLLNPWLLKQDYNQLYLTLFGVTQVSFGQKGICVYICVTLLVHVYIKRVHSIEGLLWLATYTLVPFVIQLWVTCMGLLLENVVTVTGINELKSSFCIILSHCFSMC